MRRLSLAFVAVLALGTVVRGGELKVGDDAPDFTLAASDGKTYHLADFRGKKAVVLAWFPRAFTQGCTAECKSLTANGGKLRHYDVAYFMASTDVVEGDKGNKAFAESERADFPILSDPGKETATAYGVLNPSAASPAAGRLHRQGREDRRDRQGSEAGDRGRGRDGQARRAESPEGVVAPAWAAWPLTAQPDNPARRTLACSRRAPR